jgi:hypothetical protein
VATTVGFEYVCGEQEFDYGRTTPSELWCSEEKTLLKEGVGGGGKGGGEGDVVHGFSSSEAAKMTLCDLRNTKYRNVTIKATTKSRQRDIKCKTRDGMSHRPQLSPRTQTLAG